MKHIIPLELIKLEEANYHLTVKSYFTNGEEETWVIDTGASKSVFDISLTVHYDLLPNDNNIKVQSAGIGSRQLETTLGVLHRFILGNFPVCSMKVALIDLSNINDLYYHATERKICGLIGSDFLHEHQAIIDYSRLEIRFQNTKRVFTGEKPDTCPGISPRQRIQ